MAAKGVSVWIGTKKGAYVARSDAARRKWTVAGPFLEGEDVFHASPDPRHPGTVYVAANNGWWGPALHRSRDGGKRWTEVSTPGTPRRKERTAPVEAPSPKFPIKNLWHVTPGPADDPTRLYLGVDPASLYRSDDEGDSWEGIPGLNEHPTRPKWNPGAGGMCLHTILLDPKRPNRMHIGISAAGSFRTDDGGAHWTPTNVGVGASFLPEKWPEVGQCIHKIALDPADPETIYRQDHEGIYVSHNGASKWTRVGRALESDFGFAVAAPASAPGEAFFMPLAGQSRLTFGGGFQVYRYHDANRKWTPTVKRGAFPGGYSNHRDGMATDSLDPSGIYAGTSQGTVFVSRDTGKSWAPIPYAFPYVHSVEVVAR